MYAIWIHFIKVHLVHICNRNIFLKKEILKKHAQIHWKVIKHLSIPNHIWVQGNYIVAHLFCGGGYCGYEILEHFASSYSSRIVKIFIIRRKFCLQPATRIYDNDKYPVNFSWPMFLLSCNKLILITATKVILYFTEEIVIFFPW